MNDVWLQMVTASINNLGPTRVMVDSAGTSYSVERALSEFGTKVDVIFIRNDGWSLGAPGPLERLAWNTWPDEWVAFVRRDPFGHWSAVMGIEAYARPLCFRAEACLAKHLKPGDLFSTAGPDFWATANMDPNVIGQKVYIRTAAECPESQALDQVFRVSYERPCDPVVRLKKAAAKVMADIARTNGQVGCHSAQALAEALQMFGPIP